MVQRQTYFPQGAAKSAQVEKPVLDFRAIDREMKFSRNIELNLGAGTVTFHPTKNEVLLVLNSKYHEDIWQLPKGRKNLDEDLRDTAIRETYEETGYHVKLVPIPVLTRATRPHGCTRPSVRTAPIRSAMCPAGKKDNNTVEDLSTEPMGMAQFRELQDRFGTKATKMSFFYLAELEDPEATPDQNTQDPGEGLEARWMSVGEAERELKFEAEKEALRTANELWNRLTTAMAESSHASQ